MFVKVLVLASLTVTAMGYPQHNAESYSSYSTGPISTHGSLQLSQGLLATSHAPLLVEHKPLIVAHKPVLLHKEVEVEHYAPAHYEFKYGVHDSHTHDIKEQAEKRVGDKVEGYYKLVEPDGTTRTVHYTADKHTGFHAQVSKSGHAVHPTHVQKVIAPVHKVITPIHKVISSPIISYSAHEPLLASSGYSSGGASSFSTYHL